MPNRPVKRGVICLFLAVVMLFFARPAVAVEDSGFVSSASRLTDYLAAGKTDNALAMMDEAMKTALTGTLGGVGAIWLQVRLLGGDNLGTGAYRLRQVEEYVVVEMTLLFSRTNMVQTTSFHSDGLVAGLFIRPGEVRAAESLPEGLTEELVEVDAGTGFLLQGVLTLPKALPIASVLLVHGSGPSDRDEAIGANVPFQDLAYGLAQHGIAVLRYDKRTYTYGSKLQEQNNLLERFTVDDETVDDAAAALNVLKENNILKDRPVFILGHSMGAMLASYIGTKGVTPDGYILLAGSPRKLWEIAADQQLAAAMEEETAGNAEKSEKIRDYVAAETTKAKMLAEMSDEEALAKGSGVFGLGENAWYLRHFEQIDPIAFHLADQKPVLVLQGGRDRQVKKDDYELWQERLKDHAASEFRFYPELNHLFGAYKGNVVPLSELVSVEYGTRTPVADSVITDIAKWVKRIAEE